jgi:hypothetical protein
MREKVSMDDTTVHFLLVYSFSEGKLVHTDQFIDAKEATDAYNECERRYSSSNDYEIVLVGSDSLETIMKTHGHYFRDRVDSLFSLYLEPPIERLQRGSA